MIRSFSLAEEFLNNGDKVFFTSCSGKAPFIRQQGYDVVKTYEPFNLNDPKDQSVNYLSAHKKEMVDWFNAEIEATKETNADVVITSPGFFGPHTYYATKVPVIALMNGQYLPTSKGLMGISLATDSLKDRALRRVLSPIFAKSFVKNYLAEILDAYKKLGITNDIHSRDELYEPMHILIAGDEEFEPQVTLNGKSKHIGPIFWNGFENMKTDLTEKNILEFKKDSKLVFITFGGSVFDLDTYKRILKYIPKLKAKVIVALGPNFSRENFQPDDENILIRGFVPGLRVSKFADVVVNTGSQGAIMQALQNGKPVVSFPVGIDQAYFANRLEEMKVGKNVNKSNLLRFSKRESYQITDNSVPENLISAIKEVLNNSKYSLNAQRYAERLKKRNYNPEKEVVKYVNELVNKK
jgi:UDP:flavonoid glycosyltransferase YjiC (YdhE family)